MFFFMPSIILSKVKQDTLLLELLFRYKDIHAKEISGASDNIYLRYSFQTKRRNPTLFLIPTMYTIAKGQREYIGETYGRITFNKIGEYDIKRLVVSGSLPNYRKTMPILLNYIIPDLYNVALFDEHILSPFNKTNRRFYRYRIKEMSTDDAYISFRPRIQNTQLIRGSAIVDRQTGRIKKVNIRGEYDLLKFEINTDMGDGIVNNPLLPVSSNTKSTFKFLGNSIIANFSVQIGNLTEMPDTMSTVSDIAMMDSIRPYPLNDFEKNIYQANEASKTRRDTLRKSKTRNDKIKEIAWDIIGDHMLNSMGAETSKASIRFSPLLNPLYLSYSHSRGLSYKIKMGARYNFSEKQNMTFTPHLGYNFKIKKLFFCTPLRFTYNTDRNAWVEIEWRNGNRITNSSVLDMIKNENCDTIDFSALNLDYFDDEMLQLRHNISIGKMFDLTVGTIYHERRAVNKNEFELLGKPTVYRSFAPQLTIGFHPSPTWPVFTANYERSVKGILKSNIEYERWEFDASFKKKLTGLRSYNIRAGGGFYTNKSSDYFVDYSNFHENYLPDGWDDDWTGNFQLLNSQWYNASQYYIRANTSYESPLLLFTWLPLIGKYIETERVYASVLQIEHIKPYFEIGYGITNRYFSIGLFGSIVNGKFNEFGSKFTFELFRKW